MSISKITIGQEEYPVNLRSIYMPPETIYVNGRVLRQDENAVAIVGTRLPTLYGLQQCEKLAYDLAICGVTVISGMARGIDSAAHRGAIKAGGRTIAVLGCGADIIYPRENERLYNEIAAHGAIVSEFPEGTPPLRHNFPKRNRIISGLSKGVVVVEAARKSGSLITANFALEQNREVFAIPGNVSSSKSSGTNALIKEGAKLVESVEDILDELGLKMHEAPAPGRAGEAKPFAEASDAVLQRLSSGERAVLDILTDEPKALDEIAQEADAPAGRIPLLLLKLELKRLVEALPGNGYVRRRVRV